MQDYTFTKHRVFQWIGIILALGVIAVGYYYYRSQASTLNQSQNDLTSTSLVGQWSFNGDDISGTTAYDRSASGNNGTITNTPKRVVGKVGQALNFFPNGSDTDAYVTMGDPVSGALDFGSGDFTVSFWMKGQGYYGGGNNTSSVNVAVSKKTVDTSTSAGYSFFYSSTNLMNLAMGNGSSSYTITQTVSTVADSQWHHYVGFRSGSTAYLYVDGAQVGSVAVSGSFSNSDSFDVGTDRGSTARNANAVIDEVRVYNAALSTAQIQSLYAQGGGTKVDTAVSQAAGTGRLDSGLALYYPLDDGTSGATPTTATDASTNGNTGTLTNGPTWTTGQINNAVDFDGTDDYITLADQDILDVADSSNFTLSGWFNRDTFAADHTILAKSNGQTSADTGYNVYIDDATDKVTFVANDGTDQYKLESASTFTATGWHHFAIVWDDSGSGQTKLYIDGAAEAATATGTFANVNSLANAVALRVGAESDAGNPFDGKLDEIRVYTRALSGDGVARLYQLTTPTGVDTELNGYWSFDGRDTISTKSSDNSGGVSTGTLTGGPTRTLGKIGQALSFDGSDDYVTIGDVANLRFGAVSFSISQWIKTTSTSLGYSICSYDNAATIVGVGINDTGQTNKAYFFLRDNATTVAPKIYSKTAVNDGGWHHIVAVRDASASFMYLYVDGVREATTNAGEIPGSVSFATLNNWSIGRAGNASGSYFTGSVDETRVYSKLLSASEVKALYDAGQSDLTNSSASQPQGTGRFGSGLALYYALDNGSGTSATDSSSNGNTGTLTNFPGSPTWTTGQVAGGLDFDGTDDYVTVADPDVLDVADSSNFTLSGWFNRDTENTDDTILAKSNGQTASDTGYNVYIDDTTDKVTFVANDGTNQYKMESTSTFSTSGLTGWHQFTIVWNDRSSTDTKLYIDGAYQIGTNTGTFGNVASLANAVAFRVGAESDAGNPFDGKLDELRMYSRALSGDEVANLYRLTTPSGTETNAKGYWSFNGQDISGTTAYDRSGAGNTGTLTNSPTKVPGKIGQALSFDGTDDYVDAGNASSVKPAFPFSTSEWVKLNSISNGPSILTSSDTGSNGIYSGFNVGVGTDGSLQLQTGDNAACCDPGPRKTFTSSAGVITTGQWYHIVAVFTSISNFAVYVNGSSVSLTSSGTAATLVYATNNKLRIGVFYDANTTTTKYTNGIIDEVRLYNRALSAGEAAALYNASR